LQPRILTVDDDSEARLAVQAILERERMHVTPADSAEDGLDALSRAYFDLVITDFRMAHKTGLDLIQETRDHGVGVPFILLTAEADLAIRKKAADMGVAATLSKPVRRRLLLDQVDRALSTSRLHDGRPPAEPDRRCTAKCSFSIGGFCSLLTRDALDPLK
jgi:two-component system sporulation sensor kinase A